MDFIFIFYFIHIYVISSYVFNRLANCLGIHRKSIKVEVSRALGAKALIWSALVLILVIRWRPSRLVVHLRCPFPPSHQKNKKQRRSSTVVLQTERRVAYKWISDKLHSTMRPLQSLMIITDIIFSGGPLLFFFLFLYHWG